MLSGGAIRDRDAFARYLLYRCWTDCRGGETTPGRIVAQAIGLRDRDGLRVDKLKGGNFGPRHAVAGLHALAAAFADDAIRLDHSCVWSVEQWILVRQAVAQLDTD